MPGCWLGFTHTTTIFYRTAAVNPSGSPARRGHPRYSVDPAKVNTAAHSVSVEDVPVRLPSAEIPVYIVARLRRVVGDSKRPWPTSASASCHSGCRKPSQSTVGVADQIDPRVILVQAKHDAVAAAAYLEAFRLQPPQDGERAQTAQVFGHTVAGLPRRPTPRRSRAHPRLPPLRCTEGSAPLSPVVISLQLVAG